MKKRAGLAIVVVVAIGAAFWWSRPSADSDGRGLFASGTIEATDADLGFQRPGRVASLSAAEGDHVEAGQELARLDASEIQASVHAARAQLTAAEARLRELATGSRPQELATAEAALRATERRAEEAGREAERARTLFDGGAVSRQEMQRAQTAVDVAEADLDQARQQVDLVREGPRGETVDAQRSVVEQARAQVALAEATLANTIITAPFAGTITVRHREPGEAVGAGSPVLTLMDPTDRWVRIYVQGDAIGRVQLGQSAEIRSDTWPDGAYDGEVVFIGSEAEFTPRNVQTTEERTKLVYPVKVRVSSDPGFELKPGVPADVTIRTDGP